MKFDFSNKKVFQSTKKIKDNASEYTYRDCCSVRIAVDGDGKPLAKTGGSSYDMDAIKQSLHNILTFRRGENILDPEFRNWTGL